MRQAAALKSKPIVVFSGSYTVNWPVTDCAVKLPKPVPSAEDLKYLDVFKMEKSVKNIVTGRDGASKEFSALAGLSHHYVMAGAVLFIHFISNLIFFISLLFFTLLFFMRLTLLILM